MKNERLSMGYMTDGVPCHNRGCLNHISHPCEGCGRISGRAMTSSELKRVIAQKAVDNYGSEGVAEKYIKVNNEAFEKCIEDDIKSYQETHRNRGFIRTYHDSFFVSNPDGKGQTYCHGIVYIINKDAEINQVYYLDKDNIEELNYSIKELGHRMMGYVGNMIIMKRQGYELYD